MQISEKPNKKISWLQKYRRIHERTGKHEFLGPPQQGVQKALKCWNKREQWFNVGQQSKADI